ncbi:hypothetical protein CDAR_545391 [Caerostris darwini]|uniref:Uncharacterized protein n=1 Tax=Caerostris darwini TaxID=1538125 RepID=A0AAV4ME62_9ARAC|nr:hypothetical protein CDAR_545391 [Caerostris darwini]
MGESRDFEMGDGGVDRFRDVRWGSREISKCEMRDSRFSRQEMRKSRDFEILDGEVNRFRDGRGGSRDIGWGSQEISRRQLYSIHLVTSSMLKS